MTRRIRPRLSPAPNSKLQEHVLSPKSEHEKILHLKGEPSRAVEGEALASSVLPERVGVGESSTEKCILVHSRVSTPPGPPPPLHLSWKGPLECTEITPPSSLTSPSHLPRCPPCRRPACSLVHGLGVCNSLSE